MLYQYRMYLNITNLVNKRSFVQCSIRIRIHKKSDIRMGQFG